ARRSNVDPSVRAQLDESRGHLASAGVVDADEEHLRNQFHRRRSGSVRSGSRVFVALTIAPCIPSATSCVNSTVASSNSAASRPAMYSPLESAPAMQPTYEPRSARSCVLRRSSATTSETPTLPPGFSTRPISANTAALSTERLMTQFEI